MNIINQTHFNMVLDCFFNNCNVRKHNIAVGLYLQHFEGQAKRTTSTKEGRRQAFGWWEVWLPIGKFDFLYGEVGDC